MPHTLEKGDWELLLPRIKAGKVIPILGLGGVDGTAPVDFPEPKQWPILYPYPGGRQLAEKWAQLYEYPLEDSNQLERVAQFLAVDKDPRFPKDELGRLFDATTAPDFTIPNEPHGVLADLPFPLYLTSNYDDFLVRALENRRRQPRQVLCGWNRLIGMDAFPFDPNWKPHPATPLVFYLHGISSVPQSVVLTEDDYMEFVVNLSKQSPSLPPKIEGCIAQSSLLFLGYRLTDWDFRTIFRIMVGYLRSSLGGMHVAVQIAVKDAPTSDSERKRVEKAEEYLRSYFSPLNIRIYLGSCQEFIAELKTRWDNNGN